MNNLFQAFKIVVPGQLLDNKHYWEYDDFDGEVLTTPTDAQTLDKAVAFTRLQQLQKQLSEVEVPIYYTIEFATPGTCATIPTDATIHVAYKTFSGFVPAEELQDSEKLDKALADMLEIIKGILGKELVGVYATVQKMVTRKRFPLATEETEYRETQAIYIDVPAVTPDVTVEYVAL